MLLYKQTETAANHCTEEGERAELKNCRERGTSGRGLLRSSSVNLKSAVRSPCISAVCSTSLFVPRWAGQGRMVLAVPGGVGTSGGPGGEQPGEGKSWAAWGPCPVLPFSSAHFSLRSIPVWPHSAEHVLGAQHPSMLRGCCPSHASTLTHTPNPSCASFPASHAQDRGSK